MLKISLSHIFSSVPSNRLSLLSTIFFYLCLSLFLSLISRPDMPEMRRLGQLNQSLGPNGKQQQNIQQNDSRISTEDRNTIRPSLSQHCGTHAAFTCTELNVTVINSTCWRLMSSLIVGHVLSWAAFGATITNRSLLIQIADTDTSAQHSEEEYAAGHQHHLAKNCNKTHESRFLFYHCARRMT